VSYIVWYLLACVFDVGVFVDNSSLNYYDVQKVNIRCKSICDQWNLLAQLATQRREELEVCC